MPGQVRTALLIVICAALLGATLFREQVALAAQKAAEVIIVNDTSQPVPVHEQQRISPVQVTKVALFENGQTFSPDVTIYTVPAGKVLVIQSVSASAVLGTTDRLLNVVFSVTYDDLFAFRVTMHPIDEGVFTPTSARPFRGTELASAYAGPGTTVTVSATRDGTSLGGTGLIVGISGHLIDAP